LSEFDDPVTIKSVIIVLFIFLFQQSSLSAIQVQRILNLILVTLYFLFQQSSLSGIQWQRILNLRRIFLIPKLSDLIQFLDEPIRYLPLCSHSLVGFGQRGRNYFGPVGTT